MALAVRVLPMWCVSSFDEKKVLQRSLMRGGFYRHPSGEGIVSRKNRVTYEVTEKAACGVFRQVR
jgi:hypothetical protein